VATTASAFPSLDDVREARRRITGYADTTPLVLRDGLGYKLEFLQHTGSFKVRGAFNAALQLSQAECARGVVAVSGGNHGLAIAYVGKVLGIPATVVMPKATPQFVVERATADGARVVLTETIAEAFARVDELARDGLALLHPFDDVRVIAGQGTLALEMLEQMPEVKTLVVSIGGGGLISGVASTIKQMKPDVTIVGVETKGADAMRQALDAGRPVTLPGITSIARTLGAPSVSERTLHAVRRYVDDVVVVDDRDAVAAIIELQEKLGVLVEPAASCTHAALGLGLVERVGPTLLLLCGSNVRFDEVVGWRQRFGDSSAVC
jgi:threonine dehydratase